ncbi:MAG: SDR family oxidoreductase [Phycisphaerae bacterium]|nr:SDR family oxidoreductase [Phycisphaerae bacterium]
MSAHAHVPERQRIAITGAGSGIGRELAVLLAARGHALVLIGRTQSKLDAALESCRSARSASSALPRLHALACDLAVPALARGAVRNAIEALGGLDAWVNCAGEAPLLPIAETTDASVERVFRTNAFGPAAAISEAWPQFVAQGHGCIVNVSTYGTLDPFPGFLAYAASKSALDSMTRSCHVEGRSHGIRAFSINPGAVETPMLRALFSADDLPTERTLHPRDVATVIVDCIEGRRDQDCGQVIPLLKR